MLVKIKATQLELSQKTKDFVEEKMNMLDKYLGGINVINCDVELEKTKTNQHNGKIYRAEVNLNLPGELLRVEKTEADLSKAVEKVKDHLVISIKKYKEKKMTKKRKVENIEVEDVLEV